MPGRTKSITLNRYGLFAAHAIRFQSFKTRSMDVLVWLLVELCGSFVEAYCSDSPLGQHFYDSKKNFMPYKIQKSAKTRASIVPIRARKGVFDMTIFGTAHETRGCVNTVSDTGG